MTMASETSNEWVLPERDPRVWARIEMHQAYLDHFSLREAGGPLRCGGAPLEAEDPGPLHADRPCWECGAPLRKHEAAVCSGCVRDEADAEEGE